jgi:hypothetical protein
LTKCALYDLGILPQVKRNQNSPFSITTVKNFKKPPILTVVLRHWKAFWRKMFKVKVAGNCSKKGKCCQNFEIPEKNLGQILT